MTPEIAQHIERVRHEFGDVCFACGRRNDVGLHLDGFEWDGTAVTARFQPRSDFRGADDVLHGGVAATALDEVSVWAGILGENVLTVTGTLELRYRRPIRIDDTVVARGTVTERRGRRLLVSGTLTVEGATAVESQGLFLVSREMHEL